MASSRSRDPRGVAIARQRLTVGAQIGLGAAAGLLLPAFVVPPGQATGLAIPAAVVGALLGYVLSILRQPMAPACRIPRIIGGCGGSNKVSDGSGNWRPRRPCWRHPEGPPRRFGAMLLGLGKPKEKR